MRGPAERERLQIPLMYAFRDAAQKHDAQKIEDNRVDGERLISDRGSIRRRGASEELLKRDLGVDLGYLVDTVCLGSAEDLSDLPFVQGSILNYGIPDLASMALEEGVGELVRGNLKQALLNHEPRLSRETLVVSGSQTDSHAALSEEQKISVRVAANMLCKPLDVPIEFVAEIDALAGKVVVPKLPGSA